MCAGVYAAFNRSMGILSVVTFAETLVQYSPRYNIVASIGVLKNTGRTKHIANRQTKSTVRKVPKASAISGGKERGWKKRVTCQNPIQTKH